MNRVIITVIKRIPGNRMFELTDPFTYGRCLPKSRRSGDEDQLLIIFVVKITNQAVAVYKFLTVLRNE